MIIILCMYTCGYASKAPHNFKQNLPTDVDYRVMLTFLQFYESMVKFVNFKLYHDEGLHYPPRIGLIQGY